MGSCNDAAQKGLEHVKLQTEWDSIVSVLRRRRFGFQVTLEPAKVSVAGTTYSGKPAPTQTTYSAVVKSHGEEFRITLDVMQNFARLVCRAETLTPFFGAHWRTGKTPNVRLLATTLANKIRGKLFADIHIGDD